MHTYTEYSEGDILLSDMYGWHIILIEKDECDWWTVYIPEYSEYNIYHAQDFDMSWVKVA